MAGIENDPQAKAIVTTIISLARELGVTVIGEGVETTDQLAALEEAGCDLIQGFLWGRPVNAAEIEAQLCGGGNPAVTRQA